MNEMNETVKNEIIDEVNSLDLMPVEEPEEEKANVAGVIGLAAGAALVGVAAWELGKRGIKKLRGFVETRKALAMAEEEEESEAEVIEAECTEVVEENQKKGKKK